jgi:hypothetical protein
MMALTNQTQSPFGTSVRAALALNIGEDGGLPLVNQIQASDFNFGLDTGIADAYIVNLSPAITSLTDGLMIAFTPLNYNYTALPTLTVNGFTAIIRSPGKAWLSPLDIKAGIAASTVYLIFSENDLEWILLNASVSEVNATNLQEGFYVAGIDTGTANAYIVSFTNGSSSGFYSAYSGSLIEFVPLYSNTTTSTLSVLGNYGNIILMNGDTLPSGSVLATVNASLVYGTNTTGVTGWILLNPQGVHTPSGYPVMLAPAGAQTITGYGLTVPSLAFSTTSGIIGTTTNSNAAAGSVGEESSSANATGVAMTSTVVTQIQTLSLGAGDWDVWCTFYTTVNAATISSAITCQLHTTTATIAAPTTTQLASIQSAPGTEITGQTTYLSTGISRWSLAGATTVYLNAQASYSVNTLTGNGMIHARRVR